MAHLTNKDGSAVRRKATRRLVVVLIATLVMSATTLGSTALGRTDAATDSAAKDWEILKPTNTGIPGDYVYSIAVDSNDRPWMNADDPVWDEGGLGTLRGSSWRQWTNVDGKAPTHNMRSLQFDNTGAAWMGSEVGLLKFAGRKVRTVFSMKNAPWPTNIVRDFDWDSKGNLWVALNDVQTVHGGVARFDGTTWKVWTTANGLPWDAPWDQVSALEIDDQDRVWIGSPDFGGAMFNGKKWTALGDSRGWVYDITIAPDGTPWYVFVTSGVQTWNGTGWVDRTGPFGEQNASLVTVDARGRVWVGSFLGVIWRWSGTGASYDLSYDPPSLGSHIYALDFDSKNQAYVGGIGGMDVRRTNGSWSVYTTKNTALPSRWIDDVTVDADGNGWFATAGGGLGFYDGKRWTDYNPANWGAAPWPFPTDSATSVVQAADGSIWTSPTHAGVGSWDGSTWTTHLPSWSIESLAIDPAQRVWAAPDRGEVQRWNGSKWVGMKNPSGNADLNFIASDESGTIWLATIIGLMKYDGQTWTTYNETNSGLPGNYVITVTPEPSGDAVWVGTDKGLARFDGAEWTVYTEADGLPANVVNSIASAPNGHVWIGAFDGNNWPYHGGVGEFDGETWTSYTTANSPLPHNQVQSVDVDAQGRVWIATQSEGAAIFTP